MSFRLTSHPDSTVPLFILSRGPPLPFISDRWVYRQCITISIIVILLESFSHQCYLVVFQWNMSDSKSPPLSKSLLNILADLNNAAVGMVSIFLLISNSSSLLSNYLGTVPNAPTNTDIPVTLMIHSFFCSQARSKYMAIFSLSFIFTLWSIGTTKSTWRPVLFSLLLLITTKSCFVTEIRCFVCITKSQRILCISLSRMEVPVV